MVLASVEEKREVTASRGVKLVGDVCLSELKEEEEFDCIVVPGKGLFVSYALTESSPQLLVGFTTLGGLGGSVSFSCLQWLD